MLCEVEGFCRAFSEADSLKKHVAVVHDKRRDHVCVIGGCDNAFTQPRYLKAQVNAVHNKCRDCVCEVENAAEHSLMHAT